MILTGRDGKPIIFNNTHIVAVTVASTTIHDTIKASSCIHCIGHSFFVMETIEEVYLQIYSEAMPKDILQKYGLLPKPEPITEVSQSEIRASLPVRKTPPKKP